MLSQQLQEEIQVKYDIGEIRRVTGLIGGYWNTVMRLESGSGEYVLRISHTSTSLDRLQYEHRLVALVHAHVKEVPMPIRTRKGATYTDYERKWVTLFPYIEGEIADPGNDSVRKNAAAMLANLHLVSARHPDFPQKPGHQSIVDLNWDLNSMWNWATLEQRFFGNREGLRLSTDRTEQEERCIKEINEKRRFIQAEKERIERWVGRLRQEGTSFMSGFIHGDYYAGNLLNDRRGHITAVVDWDECGKEWLIYELARSIWEFCHDAEEHRLDAGKAHAFLQDYQHEGGPVPETEFAFILPFIRYVRLVEILFNLDQGLKGQPWYPEYTVHNLKALMNLNDQTSL